MNGKKMIFSVEISTDDITTTKIASYLYLYNYFTLTVNAVNDAPVLLQPLEELEIVEDPGAAAVVLYTIFSIMVYSIFKFL